MKSPCVSEPIQATSFSVKDRLPEFNHAEFEPAPDAYWTIIDVLAFSEIIITFITFMTPPDLAIGRRFSPKKNSSKLKKNKTVTC